MASSHVQCKENERLLTALGESVRELVKFYEQHFLGLSAGEQDAERFELLIHVAREKRKAAKYAYLSHIEEHGCERRVGSATKRSKLLTLRQREVLQLVAEGRSLKEIAAILQISTKTAVFHKAQLRDRLGIHTTAQLTRYAIKHGLTP